jgi:hypothetical protein
VETLTHVAVALVALAVYCLVSLQVGDRFPFSRYVMYAQLKGRTEGAVLGLRVAGKEVPATSLEGFVGLDPSRIDARGYPCSQEWAVHETRRWVEEHQGALPSADSVPVEVGFRIVSVEQFRLLERWVPLTAGTAQRVRR